MIDKLLTIEEVAEITGLAVRTIYIRGGGTNTLPRVKIGHTLRFREADVRDWINRHVERPYDARKVLAEQRLQKRFKKSA